LPPSTTQMWGDVMLQACAWPTNAHHPLQPPLQACRPWLHTSSAAAFPESPSPQPLPRPMAPLAREPSSAAGAPRCSPTRPPRTSEASSRLLHSPPAPRCCRAWPLLAGGAGGRAGTGSHQQRPLGEATDGAPGPWASLLPISRRLGSATLTAGRVLLKLHVPAERIRADPVALLERLLVAAHGWLRCAT